MRKKESEHLTGDEEITDEIRVKIDNGDPGIRSECIEEEIEIELGRDYKSYLCKSCKWYLVRGKMPKLFAGGWG